MYILHVFPNNLELICENIDTFHIVCCPIKCWKSITNVHTETKTITDIHSAYAFFWRKNTKVNTENLLVD